MANTIWRELSGILGGVLQFTLSGFRLKNNSGVAQVRNAGDTGWADIEVESVRIHSTNATFAAILEAPSGLAADQTYTLPLAGTTIPSSSGMHVSVITAFTQASSSPLALGTPPANATLNKVRVAVDTAAAGGSPTISIGITGTTARDMATTENNLKAVGQYVTEPFLALGGSPGAQIATIVASAQTFTGRIELEYIYA